MASTKRLLMNFTCVKYTPRETTWPWSFEPSQISESALYRKLRQYGLAG